MPVYFEATLIAASLTAAVSVSAWPMLAVSTADWPTDTNCRMVKKRSECHTCWLSSAWPVSTALPPSKR